MTKRSILFFCCAVFVVNTPAFSDSHQNVARFLPEDVAFYGTLNSPSKVIANLTSIVDSELPSLEEAADLLLLTDLTDGTKRVFDSTDLGVDLLDADSIHLVVFESRAEIGSFAILIDQGQTELEVSESLARLIFRFITQVVDNGLPNNAHAGQLQEVMAKWESTLSVKSEGRWTVIASNDRLTSKLVAQLSKDQSVSKNLASNRRFQLSSSTSLGDSFLQFYVSPFQARQIALSANIEREHIWDKKKRDEIPWIGSSMRLDVMDDSLVVDMKTVVAATAPLTGENRYWNFYRPIKDYPVLWDDVHTVLGKCVDLEAWNDLAKRELDKVYGDGTFARYHDNPVAAFRTGLSRPKLGALSFSMMDSKNRRNLRLFKISEGTSDETIMGYLDSYFPALQKNRTQGGYETSYTQTEFNNIPGWWSHELKEESTVERGDGGLLLPDWVAVGCASQIKEIADLESGCARINNRTVLHNKVMSVSDRMGFAVAPHEIEYYRSQTVSAELRAYVSRTLHRIFPVGWNISEKSRQRGLEEERVRRKMTRPQLFGLYLTGLIDAVAKHDLEYIKVISVSVDRSRLEIGNTFTLTKSNADLKTPEEK